MSETHENAFASTASADTVPWWWQLLDADGRVVTGERREFPTRSDAESWVGEAYPDLAEDGVASVTLFEGDREVYGPMSLAAE
ncbi:hypothetical protein ASG49_05820 [Marmoricola sp. Leaf446]|uniref:Uncharacterized protein n=1 Tax=Nocardioides aurantiacus TaxID=86796 RepID=A0A3N2CSR8_9ACTN|nr:MULTISPECIES: hypothetical protein [Nocardioidaceae]KQT94397.1 hypothetical protein ASG49_05820 [Marmoricola sp. Leaf446]ROR90418.1 hypothetical protein EDD33_1258 [Nocardioides aurantiacus]